MRAPNGPPPPLTSSTIALYRNAMRRTPPGVVPGAGSVVAETARVVRGVGGHHRRAPPGLSPLPAFFEQAVRPFGVGGRNRVAPMKSLDTTDIRGIHLAEKIR